MALLKQNLCVAELEENLDVFTHISQQRNDNIYRADARKFLQAIAAVRLDPINPQFDDIDSMEEDVCSACPVTANNRDGRERSISDEGKKLDSVSDGVQYSDRTESVGAIGELGMVPRKTMEGNVSCYQTSHHPSSNGQYEESELRSTVVEYSPPIRLVAGNETKQFTANSGNGSGFRLIEQQAPESDKPSGSAFGFIGVSDVVDDASPRSSSTGRPSSQSASGFVHEHPSASAEDFLVEYPSMDGRDLDDMWESANDESYVACLMRMFWLVTNCVRL